MKKTEIVQLQSLQTGIRGWVAGFGGGVEFNITINVQEAKILIDFVGKAFRVTIEPTEEDEQLEKPILFTHEPGK